MPDENKGFALNRQTKIYDDVFEIFTYEDAAAHRRIVAYFHQETMEYKLKIGFALTEFCRIDCIAKGRDDFAALVEKNFDDVFSVCAAESRPKLDSFIIKKKVTDYDFGELLPENILGFELYVRPSAPIPITNFSYIVIDYENFDLESNLIIYYNVLRDEFFGEARIRKIPSMSYQFDADELDGLAKNLREHLRPRLAEIARLAAQQSKGNTAAADDAVLPNPSG